MTGRSRNTVHLLISTNVLSLPTQPVGEKPKDFQVTVYISTTNMYLEAIPAFPFNTVYTSLLLPKGLVQVCEAL